MCARSAASARAGAWVQAVWTLRVVRRTTAEPRQARGYSHFLVEDGLIRRQRSMRDRRAQPTSPPSPTRALCDRHYPTGRSSASARPSLVRDADRGFVGRRAGADGTAGVVLIKRDSSRWPASGACPAERSRSARRWRRASPARFRRRPGSSCTSATVVDVFDRILLDPDKRVRYHFVLIDYLCRPSAGRCGRVRRVGCCGGGSSDSACERYPIDRRRPRTSFARRCTATQQRHARDDRRGRPPLLQTR